MRIRDKATQLPYYNFSGNTGELEKRENGKTEKLSGEIVAKVGKPTLRWNNGNEEKDISAGMDLHFPLLHDETGEPEGILNISASSRSGRSCLDRFIRDNDLSEEYIFTSVEMKSGKHMVFVNREGQINDGQLFPWSESKGDNMAMPPAYTKGMQGSKRVLDRRIQIGWLLDLFALKLDTKRFHGETARLVAMAGLSDLADEYPEELFEDSHFKPGEEHPFAKAFADFAEKYGFADLPPKLARAVIAATGTGLPDLDNLERYLEKGKWPNDTRAEIAF